MPTKNLPLHANGHEPLSQGRTTVRVFTSGNPDFPPFLVDSLFNCKWCGEYVQTQITEEAVHVTGDPCKYADGMTTVIRLNVPSGKIVFTDDLRPVYDGYDHNESCEGGVTYNSDLGVAQVIQRFAKQGCAFGFVGDAWPDLFQTGEGEYVLANTEWSDELDAPSVPEGWTKLGDGGGDVWSYSIADFGDWMARGGDPKALDGDAEIVAVPAGVYEFTYHGGEKGFDRHSVETVVFTHIRRVD